MADWLPVLGRETTWERTAGMFCKNESQHSCHSLLWLVAFGLHFFWAFPYSFRRCSMVWFEQRDASCRAWAIRSFKYVRVCVKHVPHLDAFGRIWTHIVDELLNRLLWWIYAFFRKVGPLHSVTYCTVCNDGEVAFAVQRLALMSKIGDNNQASNFMFLPPKNDLLRKVKSLTT